MKSDFERRIRYFLGSDEELRKRELQLGQEVHSGRLPATRAAAELAEFALRRLSKDR